MSSPKAALEKFRIIRPFLEEGVPLARIAAEQALSERTLRRWTAQYRKNSLKGLERRERADKGRRRKISSRHEELVLACALQKPPIPISAIHRRVVDIANQDQGVPPTYGVVYDIVRTADPALLTLAHEGSKAYSERYDLLHRREASAPNAMWQADHTLLDIIVLDERGEAARPWLTVIMDDYSRAVAGYFLSFQAPSAWQTALALHQAIWRKTDPAWAICGIPHVLYVDNGSDFTSVHIEQVCADLKIRLIFSLPGKPRGRGRIERFFSTVNQSLLSGLPGYMPAGSPDVQPVLTMDELEEKFRRFLLEEYHQTPHSATGQTPATRWSDSGFLPHMPDSRERLDLLLLTVNKPRQVHQDGIRFQTLRYIDPTLAAFVGESVDIRYDPRDMAEIRVFHKGRFLCRAVCQELAGATVSLKDITKARNERRRTLQKTIKERRSLVDQLLNTKPSTPTRISSENKASPAAKKRKIKLYEQD